MRYAAVLVDLRGYGLLAIDLNLTECVFEVVCRVIGTPRVPRTVKNPNAVETRDLLRGK